MTLENSDPQSWLEAYLTLSEAGKEAYLAAARREIYRFLLERHLTKGRECPYRGLEVCLQHCVCESEGLINQ